MFQYTTLGPLIYVLEDDFPPATVSLRRWRSIRNRLPWVSKGSALFYVRKFRKTARRQVLVVVGRGAMLVCLQEDEIPSETYGFLQGFWPTHQPLLRPGSPETLCRWYAFE